MVRLDVYFPALRSEELLYALAIRGETLPAMEDIPELLLRLDRVLQTPVDITRFQHDPVSMIISIRRKINKFNELLFEFFSMSNIFPNSLRLVTSRINHVTNVVNDILSLTLTHNLRQDYLLVASQLAGFQADLLTLSDKTVHSNPSGHVKPVDTSPSLNSIAHRDIRPEFLATMPIRCDSMSLTPPIQMQPIGINVNSNCPPVLDDNQISFRANTGGAMPNVETELNLYKPLQREHPLDNILRGCSRCFIAAVSGGQETHCLRFPDA